MRKFSPFINSPKPDIQKVGNQSTGYIYLLKKNGLTPNENAVDMQEASRKQAKVSALFLTAIQGYADKHKISEEEAKDIFFSDSNVDINPVNYLDAASKEQYLMLLQDVSDTQYNAATLMIKYRLLYPVEVTAKAKAGSDTIKVSPLAMPLVKGDKLRFTNGFLVVSAVADAGESVVSVEPGIAVDAGEVGYLIDFETGKERVGDPHWSLNDTRDLLMESQVAALYDFYKSETGGLKTDEEPDSEPVNEGNLPNESINSAPMQLAPV